MIFPVVTRSKIKRLLVEVFCIGFQWWDSSGRIFVSKWMSVFVFFVFFPSLLGGACPTGRFFTWMVGWERDSHEWVDFRIPVKRGQLLYMYAWCKSPGADFFSAKLRHNHSNYHLKIQRIPIILQVIQSQQTSWILRNLWTKLDHWRCFGRSTSTYSWEINT